MKSDQKPKNAEKSISSSSSNLIHRGFLICGTGSTFFSIRWEPLLSPDRSFYTDTHFDFFCRFQDLLCLAMVGDSPRGHRHDGASPLPLGMDVSPAPTRWTGANTIWPHDPRSGWSYCVMVPSWVALPDSKTASSDVGGHAANSTVFFKVLVGIQSPEGVSTLHGILRRFSEFMKLNDSLKRTFPKKKLPVPPKKSLRQINHSKHHLQQRRLALSEWIVKLLGDIDVSRSAPMASFLELEDAAKAAKPDTDRQELQTWLEKGIDKEEVQTQQSENDFSEAEDNLALVDPTLIHEGIMRESTSLNALGREKISSWHVRRHSIDSDASELSFASGSELSSATAGDGRDQVSEGFPSLDGEILKAAQALVSIDQRGNVRRVLATLQRRVTTARADVEDLVARLNQETAVKEFLSTKVKDLEVELHKTKQNSMESLQQAVSIEREGYMNLQWELEESRVALARAVEEARLAQEGKTQTEERLQAVELENRRVKHTLSETSEKLQLLQVDRDSIKAKAMAEMKVLVKEIKALRKSQPELKQNLEAALRANKELEAHLQQQKKQKESRVKTLHEVGALRERLQHCTVDFLAKEDARGSESNAAVTDAADLLMTSDSRIGLLLAEAQLLAEEEDDDDDDDDGLIGETLKVTEGHNEVDDDGSSFSQVTQGDGGSFSQVTGGSVESMRKMLIDIFVDNAHLHKLVNSLTLKALLVDSKEKVQVNEVVPRKSMLYRFL